MRAFLLLCAVFCLGAAIGRESQAEDIAVPPPPKVTDLPSEKDGLKISISPTYRGGRKGEMGGFGPLVSDSPDGIEFRPNDAHINVVLQNTSTKPLNIYEEGNSWGDHCLTLKITKIDGKPLGQPLIISMSPKGYGGNVPSTRLIEPGEALVREIRLHVPAQTINPKAPVNPRDLRSYGSLYGKFPLPERVGERQVTMSVVFTHNVPYPNFPGTKAITVWTGQIASSTADYRVFWDESQLETPNI